MNKNVIITGFEPFGGEKINPSWECVRELPEKIGRFTIYKTLLPVEYGRAAELVIGKARELSPDVILCIGQAKGRSGVTPEYAALNVRDASLPDNAGRLCSCEQVVEGGREAYFTRLPVVEMCEAIRSLGVEAQVSYSAGTYVCNDLYYTLLHRYSETPVRVGFIHVPLLTEQSDGSAPSLEKEQIVIALTAAVEAIDGDKNRIAKDKSGF